MEFDSLVMYLLEIDSLVELHNSIRLDKYLNSLDNFTVKRNNSRSMVSIKG